MTGTTLALILTSVTLSACAQVLFKIGVSPVPGQTTTIGGLSLAETIVVLLLRPSVLGGLALYGFGTMLWLGALARTELSQAYPFVAIGFVLTTIFGYMLFDERLVPLRLIGTALIIFGVFLVAKN